MLNTQYLGNEGYLLMGAVFEVYKEQGSGLSEEIYQESLEIELKIRKIQYSSKSQLKVYYKGKELHRKYVPDLIVFDEIIVELKSVKKLLPEHDAQLLNYMKITKKAIGYLINFGSPSEIEWKRFILKVYVKHP